MGRHKADDHRDQELVEVDHFIPLAENRAFRNELANLDLTSHTENRQKGAKVGKEELELERQLLEAMKAEDEKPQVAR